MATTAGKVLVDITFNPDTKQLEKVVQDAEGKPIRQKIELDKGGLEGPLKDLQEFTARLSNGGISKGFDQLKQGMGTFTKLSSEGASTSTALAGGLSKLGVEASAVVTATLAAAAGVAAIGAAAVAAAFSLDESSRAIARQTMNLENVTQATLGYVSAAQAFTIRNAAFDQGIRLSREQLAQVAVAITRYSKLTGVDAAKATELYTAAINGNRQAAMQLNTSLRGVTTQAGVTSAVLQQASREATSGAGTQTLGEQWDALLVDIKDYGKAMADFFGVIVMPVIRGIMGIAGRIFRFLGEQGRQFSRELAEWLNPDGFLDTQRRMNQMENDRVAAGQRRAEFTAMDERHSRISLANQRRQLDALHLGIPIMGRRATLEQQLSAAKLEYIRLQTLANSGDVDAMRRLQEAGNKILQITAEQQQNRETASQQAEQARQQRQQFDQAMMQLRVETQILRQRGERNTAAVEGIGLEQRRSQLVQAVENFNLDGLRTDAQRNTALALRTRLVSEIATIEQGLAAIKEREGQVAATRNATTARNRADSQRAFDQVLAYRDRNYAAHQREVDILGVALQRASQGLELTRAQTAALNGATTATDRLRAAQAENEAAIVQIQTALQAGNLTEERRLQLADQLIERQQRKNALELEGLDLRARANMTDIQRDEEFATNANNTIKRAGGMTAALASAAGGFKTFGQSATDLGTNVLGKVSNAFGGLVAAAIEGKNSFGEAARAALKEMLASISQEAAVNALKQTAMGFSLLANPITAPLAPTAFAAAALWGGVAVAAGGASAAIPSPPDVSKSNASAGSVAGTSSDTSKTEEQTGGPIIININTRLFDTAENVEDAIYDGVRGAERRRGRR
jgi:hypothetical protein